MEAAAGGEDGEEPPREARVLGSELVETYTVRGRREAAAGGPAEANRGGGGGEGREGRAGRRVMVAAAGGGVGERARLAAASGSLRGAGGSGLRPGSVLRCLPLSAADSLPPLRKPSNSSRPALVPTLKPERE